MENSQASQSSTRPRRQVVDVLSQAFLTVRQVLPRYQHSSRHSMLLSMCDLIQELERKNADLSSQIVGLHSQIDYNYHHSNVVMMREIIVSITNSEIVTQPPSSTSIVLGRDILNDSSINERVEETSNASTELEGDDEEADPVSFKRTRLA